jgi:CubicO group peptidase (beta-lactamase class C family)
MTQPTSSKIRKKILYGILVFILLVISGAAIYLSTLLPIITGYAAKNLCSAIFVSGRTQEDVESIDLNFSFIKFTKNKIDFSDSSVTSRFLWGKSKAIFRNEMGTTLLRKTKESKVRKIDFHGLSNPGYKRDTIPWPLGDILPDSLTGINIDSLKSITNRIVNKGSYGGNAFAFLVLHKGIPVAEAYDPQFNINTRFLSWSMAKSVMNALTGILVNQNKLDIYKPAGIEEWKNDDRSKITLNDLMQMQSGLKWNEDYGNRSDVTLMLHCKNDMARFAFNQPLEYPVGSHFLYSSGTANIISYIIRQKFNDDAAYYAFPYEQLFYKIGITDAVFETDPSGNYVGSSYLYATARDFARFALLYQQDGVFNKVRLLPEGWVKYTRTPASESEGEYGSLFWLNGKGEVPSAPADTYMCIGHDGQQIFILPQQELIVVVLGYSPHSSMNFDRLLVDITKAL